MNSKVVLSVHGIETRGEWQKDITPYLSKLGWTYYPYDYGRFHWFSLLSAGRRRREVNDFRDEYARVREQEDERPSVIAHSFGTYIVASALKQYEVIKLDKVIFCASIVEREFDWEPILERGQVHAVRNDYGRLDLWPKVAKAFIPGTGDSGTDGFTSNDPRIIDKAFPEHRHSDYFHTLHFREYWIPFLEMDWAERIRKIQVLLSDVVETVSDQLGIDKTSLRSNIFFLDNNEILRIFPELHHNMRRRRARWELEIEIPIGQGATGSAYRQRLPTILAESEDWAKYGLAEQEETKVHRGLRWIVSVPINDPADAREVIGVLNVDCLGETRTKDELTGILPDIRPAAETIAAHFSQIVGTASPVSVAGTP